MMTRVGLRPENPRESVLLPAKPLPFVSVIVPMRNEEAFIGKTLEQLLMQNYDPARFEILVADGQSTDASREVVRAYEARHANLRLLYNRKRWSSAGRNVALQVARGDIVVVIDAHCELDNDNYLLDLVEAFERSGADCVGRPQPLDVSNASSLQRAIAVARSSRLGHNPDSYIYTATEQFVRPQSVAVAYRRSVFERIGLFDEEFDACEDVEFNHRIDQAGLRCYFTPKVRARYYPRSTVMGLFRQMARYGRGRVRLFRKHRETFTVPCFLPAAFMLGVFAGPALAWMSPWLAGAYLGVLGLYALVLLLAGLFMGFKAWDFRLIGWLPPVFLAIHCGAGTGLLQEIMVGWWRQWTPYKKTLEPQTIPIVDHYLVPGVPESTARRAG
jgi:succinoglycan biosynthesis protein ExoA